MEAILRTNLTCRLGIGATQCFDLAGVKEAGAPAKRGLPPSTRVMQHHCI